MAEAAFYVIMFAIAVTALAICPKLSEKVNLLVSIMFSYVTVLCIGALGAFVINAIGIPIRLLTMGIVYFLIAIVGIFICIQKRAVQRLFIRKWDIVALVVCTLAVGLVSLYIFTPYIHINYYNPVDSGNHFLWAMEVVRKERINGMFFAALYNGMIINLFKWVLPATWTYKAFILADIFHVLMELLFFYAVSVILMKKTKKQWSPLVVSLLYWCGYPLFSFAVGAYIYWGMAVMLVEYVLLLLWEYEKRAEGRRYLLVCVLIGCFGVSICYIQLAPGLFLTFFCMIIYHAVQDKKIQVNKKNIIMAICGIAVAGICAFIGYQMIFASRNLKIFEAFRIGSMNANALELLVICPFVVCVLLEIRDRREKWNVFHIGTFIYGGMQFVMTVMSCLGFISTYYLFKSYIVLWFMAFVVLMEKGSYLGKKRWGQWRLYILGVICFLTLSYDGKGSEAVSINQSIFMQNMDVFVNADFSNGYMSDNGKLHLFQYAMEKLPQDSKVQLLVTNERKGAGGWYLGIYERATYIYQPTWSREELDTVLERDNVQYFIIFFDDPLYREALKDYLNTYERVYENENGFVAKRY